MNAKTVKQRVMHSSMLKQGRPRLWLGAARDMIQRTQAYYAIINASLLLITTYTIRETTIKTHLPWFDFRWLLLFLVTFIVTVVLIDYKFIYPSQIAFHQHEAWKHRSPVRKDLEAVKEELALMNESIARIEGTLGDMRDGR